MNKVAIIYGGEGAEAKVSEVTCAAFSKALDAMKIEYIKIEADDHLPEKLAKLQPRVALLAGHGKYAEDGTVQGLCEYLKIPYSGSGVLSSAICMDKAYCKMIFEKNGLPTAKYQIIDLNKTKMTEFRLELSFPIVVKPSREGSSIGVSIVKTSKEFGSAIELAGHYDHIVLIEKFIDGKEVTVPFFANRALTSIEIAPKTDFYNYENKYTAGKTDYILPANLEKRTIDKINELTLTVAEMLRIRAYARVDFMIDRQENPYLMEVNTLPGCTPTSLVPKSAAYEGLSFNDFVKYLIDSASLDYQGLTNRA